MADNKITKPYNARDILNRRNKKEYGASDILFRRNKDTIISDIKTKQDEYQTALKEYQDYYNSTLFDENGKSKSEYRGMGAVGKSFRYLQNAERKRQALEEAVNKWGDFLGADYKSSMTDYLTDTGSGIKKMHEGFSADAQFMGQFSSAEDPEAAYNEYLAQQEQAEKEKTEFLNYASTYDLEAEEKKLEEMISLYNKYDKSEGEKNKREYQWHGYANRTDLEYAIEDKKAEINNFKANTVKYNTEDKSPTSLTFIGMGGDATSLENADIAPVPVFSITNPSADTLMLYKALGEENKQQLERQKKMREEGYTGDKAFEGKASNVEYYEDNPQAKFVTFATDEEYETFSEIYKQYGQGAAFSYAESLDDLINERMYEKIYEARYEGDFLAKVSNTLTANLEGSIRDMGEYVDSAIDDLRGKRLEVSTDLERGQSSYNVSQTSGIEKLALDYIGTSAAQLPAVLAGVLIPGGVGTAVSSAMFYASASGNALQQAKAKGYSDDQAMAYANLVGISETALERVLGGLPGISKSSEMFKSLVVGVDNALARIALQAVGSGVGEFLEESLQTYIEPFIATMVANEEYDAPKISEALYSGLLGFLTGAGMTTVSASVGEFQTSNLGNKIKAAPGAVAELADLAQSMPENSTAYKLSQNINESSDPNAVGRLYRAVGESLSNDNIEGKKRYEAILKSSLSDVEALRKEEAQYSISYTEDNKPVAVIEGDIFDGRFEEMSETERIKTVKKAIKGFRPGIPISGRFIAVTGKTAGHFTNSDYTDKIRNKDKATYRDKLNVAQNIEDVVYASTDYINEEIKHKRNDDIEQFSRGNVLLDINGERYSAEVLVGYTVHNEMILYDVQNLVPANFDIKKKKAQPKLAGNDSYTSRTVTPSVNQDFAVQSVSSETIANTPQSSRPTTIISNYSEKVNNENIDSKFDNSSTMAEQELVRAINRANISDESRGQAKRMYKTPEGVNADSEEGVRHAREFAEDFETAVMAGREAQRTGEAIPDLIENGYVTTMTESQVDTAIKMGRIEAIEAQQATAIKAEAYTAITSRTVEEVRAETNADTTLTTVQKAAARIAEALGTAVGFYNSADLFDNQRDGFKTKNGVIYLDRNTSDPIRQVFVHELAHFSEDSKSYKKLVNAITNSKLFEKWIASKGVAGKDGLARMDNYLLKIENEYKKSGVKLDEDGAKAEMIARFLGEHFESEEKFNHLLKSFNAQERRTFLQKLGDLIQKIKKALSGKSMPKELRDIEKWYQKALKESVVSENESGKEAFSKPENSFEKDRYFDSQINKWEDLKYGSYVKVGILNNNHPIVKIGMPAGPIRYDVSKIKKNMSDHGDYLTADLLKKIPDIIADPIAITEYEQGKTISVFGNYFVNSSPMMVGITVSKDRAGNDISKVRTYNARRDVNKLINDSSILYLSENKKDTRKWFQACGIQVPLGETKFGVIRSISEIGEKVKTESFSIPEGTNYSDYDKPITVNDVQSLRDIGRKSINAFTDSDIKASAKWAHKFYQELGTKSPFFRAWFGDWRAFDTNTTQIVEASRNEGKNPRGPYENKDTGWIINSSSVGYDETISHSGKDKMSIIAMRNIDKIIENSILLDTEVSEYGRGKKSVYTAFMHKFYAVCRINGNAYIAKMSVDESYSPGQNDTNKKFYHVRAIEIETAPSVGIGNSHTPIIEDTVSNISISDLFKLVKKYDKEFKPNSVNAALLNEDGSPKVFYHGTNKRFTVFEVNEIAAREGSFFFAENPEDAAAYGKYVMPVYVTGENLADYDDQPSEFYGLENKNDQVKWLKERGYDGWYADMDSDGWGEVSVFSPEQIKSAENNIGTFNKYDADTQFSIPEEANRKIEIGMSDEERYNILKDKKIQLVAKVDPKELTKISRKFEIDENTIESLQYTTRRKLIKKIGEQFNVFKDYSNSDVNLEFQYSKGNLKESLNKQKSAYYTFVKMLSCFDQVIANAVGIEAHNRNDAKYKRDDTLKAVYVMASAFVEGNNIIPVKLEVKEFFDKKNTLYVAIALKSVIKNGVVTQEVAENSVAQQYARPSTISLSDLFLNVNPQDESFYKYIPEQFLEQNENKFSIPETFADEERSSREDLAEVLETVAKTEAERELIENYKKNISVLETYEEQLRELKEERWNLSFSEGPRNVERLNELTSEIERLTEMISRQDRRLLKLEASAPLKNLVVRARNEVVDERSVRGRVFTQQYMDETLQSFGITAPKDYIHVQRQVLATLESEGFFTNKEKRSRVDINEASGMDIETNKSSIDETFNYHNYATSGINKKIAKLATIRLIPQIIKNGTLVKDNVPNQYKDSENKTFAYIESKVSVDGKEIQLKLDIKKTRQKNKFYVHNIVNIEKVSSFPAGTEVQRQGKTTADEDTISQPAENVKTQFAIPEDSVDTIQTESSREDLAEALETVAKTEAERELIENYKKNISVLETYEEQLRELKEERWNLSFSEGPRNVERLNELTSEIERLTEMISRQDRRLLKLEASAPLKNLVAREKSKSERTTAKRYQEARKRDVEGWKKTQHRIHIAKKFNELNKWLLSPTKAKHIPENMRSAVANFLEAIDFGQVERYVKAIEQFEDRMATTKDYKEFDELFEQTRKKVTKKDALEIALERMQIAYSDIQKSGDSITKEAFDPDVLAMLEKARTEVKGTQVYDLSRSQLETLDEAITALHHTITNANTLFNEDIKRTRKEIGLRIENETAHTNGWLTKRLNQVIAPHLKPTTFFENVGSQTLNMLYKAVERAESQKYLAAEEAKKFARKTGEKYGAAKWDTDTRISIPAANGQTNSLSLGEIMSLYAYSQRPQARQHLEVGGFEFSREAFKKWKKSKPKKNDGADVIETVVERLFASNKISTLDEQSFEAVEEILTSEQKAFVNEMVKYLSEDMSKLGNAVTMKRYGINGFKEKYYFPIVSSPNFLSYAPDKTADPQILNSGFSKELNPEATNPMLLFDFMELWGKHVDNMTTYAYYALPMEDLLKAYNFGNVKKNIETANGESWNNYIQQLFRDVNQSAGGSTVFFMNKGLKWFKMSSTGLSLSVVIQQPSSLPRAFAYIEPKYFVSTQNLSQEKYDKVWTRMKKHSGLAILKDIGGFDTDLGKGTPGYITGKKLLSERISAIVGAAPQFADKVAWVWMWNASENKVLAETDLAYNSAEYWDRVTEVFENAIRHSQVYDSTLSRNQTMRNKDTGAKMSTSFMSEPTTILNMVYDAAMKAKNGNVRRANAIMSSVSVAVLLNSFLSSLVYAMRDDDEDESYTEKFLESFVVETLESLNFINYIPIARDIWSLLMGYSVERTDLAYFSNIIDELKNIISLASKGESISAEDWLSLFARIINPFIPFYNLGRDLKGFKNLFVMPKGASKMGYAAAFRSAIRKSIPILSYLNDPVTKSDALYDSIVSGDSIYHDRLKSTYDSKEKYNSALVSGLRNNDGRIAEAAEAMLNDDVGARVDIIKEIEKEGNFDLEIITKAVKQEANSIESKVDKALEYKKAGKIGKYEKTVKELKDKYSERLIDELLKSPGEDKQESTNSYQSYYTNQDLNSALEFGDMEAYSEAKEERIEAYKANGKTEKEATSALRSSVTSYWKPLYIAAWENGDENEMQRIQKLLIASELYGNSAAVKSTLRGWYTEYKKKTD